MKRSALPRLVIGSVLLIISITLIVSAIPWYRVNCIQNPYYYWCQDPHSISLFWVYLAFGLIFLFAALATLITVFRSTKTSFPEESKAVSRPWAHNQPKTYQEGRPVFCQRCGARQRFENPKFCSNCGSPLKTKMQD